MVALELRQICYLIILKLFQNRWKLRVHPRASVNYKCLPGISQSCSRITANATLSFMLYAVRYMLYAACALLYALQYILYAVCFMSYALCCKIYVLCCMCCAVCLSLERFQNNSVMPQFTINQQHFWCPFHLQASSKTQSSKAVRRHGLQF